MMVGLRSQLLSGVGEAGVVIRIEIGGIVTNASTTRRQTMAAQVPSEAGEMSEGFATLSTVVKRLWFRLSRSGCQ